MTAYGTGMRRSEVVRIRVSDIDSQRMIIRVVQGKGGKDRDLPLSPELLETLRAYWRWRSPKVYLFPSRGERRGPDVPLSDKTVWQVCGDAARKAGITKHVTRIPCATVGPHTCSKPAPTCALSRCCSATEIWRPLRAIFIFRRNTCILRRIRWRSSSFPKGRKAIQGLNLKSKDEPACRGGGRHPPRTGQPFSGQVRIEFRLSAAQGLPRHSEVPHRGSGWTSRFLSTMRAPGHLL